MDLIYFILCAYGMTQILVYGSIFDNVRPSHHFFKCPMCMGFWTSAFLFGINGYTELFSFSYSISNLFILSCLGSGTSYALIKLFGDYGFNVCLKGNEDD